MVKEQRAGVFSAIARPWDLQIS
eukprot:COSAG01_NODE_21456_length_901_cov_1.341646_2_plen_22_part_01